MDQVGPPPGMLFLAIGLIALGGYGLWRERRRRSPPTASEQGDP